MKRFWACLLCAWMVTLSLSQAAWAESAPPEAEISFSDVEYETETETFSADDSAPEGSLAAPSDTDDGWPKRIVITVGGDCTIGCTDAQRSRSDGFAAVVKEKGYAWPFSGLVDVFGRDDLTLVNFEGTLTESTDKVDKKFNFKGPAEYAEILTLGSVEAVTLANNHYGDFGDQGKADTRAALSAQGIVYCASGAPTVYEVRGVKIGLIGNTFPYENGKKDISGDVKALRDKGCQIVVASFHWGSEYEPYTRDQRNIGRAAIKAGADVVVGHHPHVIQGIERYEGTYILYSLGNLVFGGNTDPGDRDAYVAQLTFTVSENGGVEGPELKILPIRTTSQGSGTDYRPVFAQGETYERILKKILNAPPALTDFKNPN